VDTSRIAAFSVLADLPAAEFDELAAAISEVEVEAGAKVITGQRTGTAVARTPMRLLSLSRQDFERIRVRVPELERSLHRLGFERAGR
jgi:CRP-like cAMP-binding protein